MLKAIKTQGRRALEGIIVFAPWLLSMYVLYWLEYASIWTSETAHRGKMSVAILATGMALSFAVHTLLAKRKQTPPGNLSV